MAISRDEIDKYIFDPENPKQCKSYKLLLRIAKRENITFFSPYFLRYFLGGGLLDGKFKDELWDIPENYGSLSFQEKIDLYITQLSESDFEEYKESLSENDLPFYNIMKYTFWDIFLSTYIKKYISVNRYIYGYEFSYNDKSEIINHMIKLIFKNEENYNKDYDYIAEDSYHHIFLLKNHFKILQSTIHKSSISISMEEDIEEYLENENNNVKPIFLKNIEDIEILLNVLQKDIQQDKYATKAKEEIATIDSINVENFFSIESMKLDNLEDKREIYIVGENGDGKTLLLQSIAIGLAGVKQGDVFDLIKSQDKAKIEIVDSSKIKHTQNESIYEYIFAYGATRYNSCQMKEDETGYLTLFENRYDLRSPVEWLQYLDHNEKSAKSNIVSVEEAKKLLNMLLNKEVEIEITPDDVLFKERGSTVSFEQLSAGYKGVVTIICDLIARLYEKQPYVVEIKDFRGIVLIDEVELHLHPKWKYNFMKKLRDTFPLIQFIVTTHSPTVILGASKEAIFYKIYKEDGEVKISNQISNEGYTHNSLISSPLFDLDSITSRDYEKRRVSSDDYVYDKIHQVVSERIKEDVNTSEDEIMKLINEELDKL